MTRLMELQCGAIGEARWSLEDARPSAVEATHRARDFIYRADWLRERFLDTRLPDVGGLVKLFERGAIESRVWSSTPGRYVGAAPEEQDGDFDFEETLKSIHIDFRELNEKEMGI